MDTETLRTVQQPAIRLNFGLETGASAEEIATLLRLTLRYCVVLPDPGRPVYLSATVTPQP